MESAILKLNNNDSHPLYPEIRSLVLKTSGLADVIREAPGQESIRLAFVFGSVANGSETSESDIDLQGSSEPFALL